MMDDNSLSGIYGIAFGCPVDERCKSCPFLPMNQLAFKDKVEWIDNLSEDRKRQIFEQHLNCSKKRVNSKMNNNFLNQKSKD